MTELDDFFNGLDQTLDTIRQQRDLPSISAAVRLNGATRWKAACGRATLEPARPASPALVYPLGSVTKVFIATMLMQLIERGVVALEDPVTRYIPEYRVRSPFPNTPATSLRQLAAHTAGLPRDAAINFPMNHTLAAWEFSDGQAPLHWYATTQEVLDSLTTVELELPPDTAKVYSNLGIMLLGIALERACGQNIRAYMAEHIFAPLGLTSAGFLDDPHHWDERFPTGYSRSSRGSAPFPAPSWQLGAAIYTGGIYATAEDLAKFCASFMDVHSPILNAASIQRMIHPAAQGEFSLGWWRGHHAGFVNFGHAGAHVGFITAGLFVPELELAVAVQTNRWNPVMDSEDSTAIARELLARLCPLVKRSRPPFDPSSVHLEDYTGIYCLPGNYASAEVSVHNGLLRIQLSGVEAAVMTFAPVAPLAFGPPGSSIPAITFQSEASGRITALTYALFRFQRK